MMPSMSLSANSSATSSAGPIDATQNALREGDWNISNAPNSGVGSLGMNKTMMYVAIAAAVYYFVIKKKAA